MPGVERRSGCTSRVSRTDRSLSSNHDLSSAISSPGECSADGCRASLTCHCHWILFDWHPPARRHPLTTMISYLLPPERFTLLSAFQNTSPKPNAPPRPPSAAAAPPLSGIAVHANYSAFVVTAGRDAPDVCVRRTCRSNEPGDVVIGFFSPLSLHKALAAVLSLAVLLIVTVFSCVWMWKLLVWTLVSRIPQSPLNTGRLGV